MSSMPKCYLYQIQNRKLLGLNVFIFVAVPVSTVFLVIKCHNHDCAWRYL